MPIMPTLGVLNKLDCSWPQLIVQLMFSEASLFTFCHWTDGCDAYVVKNYLETSEQVNVTCFIGYWVEFARTR